MNSNFHTSSHYVDCFLCWIIIGLVHMVFYVLITHAKILGIYFVIFLFPKVNLSAVSFTYVIMCQDVLLSYNTVEYSVALIFLTWTMDIMPSKTQNHRLARYDDDDKKAVIFPPSTTIDAMTMTYTRNKMTGFT